ncbi:ABC transporter substrate-binding protein [Hoyosella sp. YIM 151337]|uniref:siderophore ABC transporter substrate-binding protein n=1 Tax=Hoyosella sp. YIM 151337 TaxID=2992742 RepID=UPI002235A331|nr:ABC transporter substrate-binding protein [Hoyosella sp. YIM 151337]MCW4352107.1 ABC transporter substrate-binding protein [Hoyosella sp. YIM 151337]
MRRSVKSGVATASITLTVALILTACGSGTANNTNGDAAAGETFEFTFEYASGPDDDPVYQETTVEVPKNPANVVIFDIATLDTFGSLGGEAAGAPLEWVPDYLQQYLADDAYDAGTLFEADLLTIEANQPDLILIGGRSSTLYQELSQIAPTVDLTSQGSFEETMARNVTFLGEVLGAEDAAATALDELTAGIEEARQVTAGIGTGLSVIVSGDRISALKPSNGDYSDRNLRTGLVYDVFGVTPVVTDIEAATHGEPISFEFLLEHDPDYLFVTDRNAATGEANGDSARVVLDNPIVRQTTAHRENQIVYLDPTAWYIVFGGITTTQIMIDQILEIAA